MTISLSINEIIKQIHARIALDRTLHDDLPACELLTPSRRDALEATVAAAFADTVTSLWPMVADIGLPGDTAGEGFMTLELPTAGALPPGWGLMLAREVENAVAMTTLVMVHINADTPAAARYEAAARTSTARIVEILDRAAPGAISPHHF